MYRFYSIRPFFKVWFSSSVVWSRVLFFDFQSLEFHLAPSPVVSGESSFVEDSANAKNATPLPVAGFLMP